MLYVISQEMWRFDESCASRVPLPTFLSWFHFKGWDYGYGI